MIDKERALRHRRRVLEETELGNIRPGKQLHFITMSIIVDMSRRRTANLDEPVELRADGFDPFGNSDGVVEDSIGSVDIVRPLRADSSMYVRVCVTAGIRQ